MWLVVGLGIALVLVGLVAARRRGGHAVDLGAVSNEWIAEHRVGLGPDDQRR
jgi:hypothetical protein